MDGSLQLHSCVGTPSQVCLTRIHGGEDLTLCFKDSRDSALQRKNRNSTKCGSRPLAARLSGRRFGNSRFMHRSGKLRGEEEEKQDVYTRRFCRRSNLTYF